MNIDYLILWPFKSKRLPFFSTKSFWSSKRRRGSYFCILACTGAWSASVAELDPSTCPEPLELEEAADEELAAGDVAELEFPTSSVTDEELETFTDEELEATEELLFCTEELDAGTSCFATPATANSGA